MTGKVINSGANGTLLVLLPLALAMVVLFVAWPFFVALFVVGLIWKLWQTYQWQQLSQKIDPIFNQLVQANQGCLTVLDMSMKASINASTAKWYLERKTEEYGAVRRLYQDKSIIYYFLTASALGSIFDDSEPESDTELAPEENPSLTNNSSLVDTQQIEADTSSISTENQNIVTNTGEIKQENKTQPPPTNESPPLTSETDIANLASGLNQADLAKRLEVHSTTISKRKSEPDFTIWSQTKDPEGIAWQYIDDTKIFMPLKSEPESS
jgi:hypothetical protein